MKIFRKKAVAQVIKPLEPAEMPEPSDATGFIRRAMAWYARQKHENAVRDFQRAVELDADSVDGHYGMGMAFKAMRRSDDAERAFRQVLSLLDGGVVKIHDRQEMLHRLALGHINEIRQGDWNLEKEIWKHED